MTNHTPSPWEWVESDEYGFSTLWNPETRVEILHPGGINDGDTPIVWMGEMLSDEDRLLMQASPDMHEALEDIVDYYKNTYHHSNHVLIKGQAALKLAKEGRPNE